MLQLIEYSLKATSTVVEILRYSSFIFVASECCFFLFEKNINISCGLFPKFMLFHSFFPVVSVLFSSVFVLVLQISLWFIFSAWLFTLRNAMAESKFCQRFSVSEFDNTNILCASRGARITKKFSLRVRILFKSRGTKFSVICCSPFVR